jgi:NCS1 family nucleobase:cation symporter-1
MSHEIRESRLFNEDLAPVPFDKRTWGKWSIAALWIGMAVCITTYTLASGMITQGMSWWQALITVTLGNFIVLLPMTLNAHAGTRYGIPFPVLVRSSFGTFGSNIPALMRAIVACGWFGIQTWIGGFAIYVLLARITGFTQATAADALPVIGISPGELACFLLFWAVNVSIIIAGIESIKWLENLAAPFLIITGLALLAWGIHAGGGFGKVLSPETVLKVRGKLPDHFNFWAVFWPNLTAMIGYWATLSLNIPDFTRFARSQRDQVLGQMIGLPTTMALFAFIGIAVTCASVLVYGEAIWDPIVLLGKFNSAFLVCVSLFALTIATLSTNIAANVVSPANDFSNLSPRKISFKMGGIITGVVGILIMPWKLYMDPSAYIFTWLIGYSGLLGAIAGVMLTDYFLVRKTVLALDDLYSETGEYSYGGKGFNWRAIAALIIGILPNIPGFLDNIHAIKLSKILGDQSGFTGAPFWLNLYTYAWFVGLFVAGIAYLVLNAISPVAVLSGKYKAQIAASDMENA